MISLTVICKFCKKFQSSFMYPAESFVCNSKWNALTSKILWQHTHSKMVGIFPQFLQLHHSCELNLPCWVSALLWSLPSMQLGQICLDDTGSNWKPGILSSIFPRETFLTLVLKYLLCFQQKVFRGFIFCYFVQILVKMFPKQIYYFFI